MIFRFKRRVRSVTCLFLSLSFTIALFLCWLSFVMVTRHNDADPRQQHDEHYQQAQHLLHSQYFNSSSSSSQQLKQDNRITITHNNITSTFVGSAKEFQRIERLRARAAKREIQRRLRPSISKLIQNDTIIGDVQFLLDFAIIGFGKCGTSTLLHWLRNSGHDTRIQCLPMENWELMNGRPDRLVQWLYHELPADESADPTHKYKRCYKSPGEITQPHILEYFRTYWPATKLFVGIRHPIHFFESLYNFRVQSLETMLPPSELIGRCMKGMKHTCTERANFAYHLLQLGKQNHPNATAPGAGAASKTISLLQDAIVGRYKTLAWYNVSAVPYMPNPVFLFDMEQLAYNDDTNNNNETRALQFRRDVQTFLELTNDNDYSSKLLLPPIPHIRPGVAWSASIQKDRDARKIDICDTAHNAVRKELLRLAQQTSQWIRAVFLQLPTVHVSSRDHFNEILESYMRDPCEDKKKNAKSKMDEQLS